MVTQEQFNEAAPKMAAALSDLLPVPNVTYVLLLRATSAEGGLPMCLSNLNLDSGSLAEYVEWFSANVIRQTETELMTFAKTAAGEYQEV